MPACCNRFYTEEAFSFRLRDLFPDCLRILDMQDMHALRLGQCTAPAVDLSTAVFAHQGQNS